MEIDSEKVNYCHDPEIALSGKGVGVTDGATLNKAFSLGEGPYNAQDFAEEWLRDQAKLRKRGRLPRTALSKKRKRIILARNGYS